MASKWCFRWPHCACGIQKVDELIENGSKLLVYRNDLGELKRVPCSEIRAFAIVEELEEGQFSMDCPRVRGESLDSEATA